MNIKFLVGISILLIATWSFHNPAPRESGIEGQVLMGPMCPVAQQGQGCPDQPYQATITVNSPNGGTIMQFQTDGAGHFKIPLAPGEYILHPRIAQWNPFRGGSIHCGGRQSIHTDRCEVR